MGIRRGKDLVEVPHVPVATLETKSEPTVRISAVRGDFLFQSQKCVAEFATFSRVFLPWTAFNKH